MQHNTPREHTDEQEPSGPGHRTRDRTHRAGTLVSRIQVAQDTAQQHSTPSVRTGEQEPTGPGHRTCDTSHRRRTPVNRSQVAQDTAHVTERTEGTHR